MSGPELSPCPTLGCTSYIAPDIAYCARCRQAAAENHGSHFTRCACRPPHPGGHGECRRCALPIRRRTSPITTATPRLEALGREL